MSECHVLDKKDGTLQNYSQLIIASDFNNFDMNLNMFTMTKRILCALFTLCILTNSISGQVTIGAGTAPQEFSILEIVSNGKGGFRLPQLTTIERDALNLSANPSEANGLTIFNTSTECYEYWNGVRWVSLCEGSSQMLITPMPCLEIEADGTGCDTEFTITDPDCPVGPFSFAVVAGSDYASLSDANGNDGTFKIAFQANNSIHVRSAIIRVTSGCTSLYKDFLFTQKGQECDGTLGQAPEISSYPTGKNISFCASGAIFLSIPANTPNLDELIWTRNGVEIARGVSNITVTQTGSYDVWMGIIGCGQKPGNAVIVSKNSDLAPLPVDFIVVGNNGVACGPGGEVELIVTSPMAGTITWYRNGQKTALTGSQILAGTGNWFAVVEDGSCISRPTDIISVVENTTAGSTPEPVMKINGVISGWNICKGGSMYLQVDSPVAGIKYTWYINNDEIGTGINVLQPVPDSENFVLRLRATGTGCAREALVLQTVDSGQAPNPPFITTNTNDVLCGGQSTLTAVNAPTATAYRWFKDGVEVEGKTTASITVTSTGNYTVIAIAGGCASIESGVKVITASDFATLSWGSHPTLANVGDTKTYSVSMNFSEQAVYAWSVTGGTITNGQGTSSVTVNFATAGEATVTCTASNACGISAGSPLQQTVTVSAGCIDAQITNTNNLNANVKINQSVILSVTASGTAPLTYQWYSGAVQSTTSPVGTGSAYTATSSTTGTKLYWCRVIGASPCDTPADSPQFTVNVTADPETLPIGKGSFVGKTCFDIATGNNGTNSCGTLASRATQKTDFSLRTPQNGGTAPYSGVQIYSFIPSGVISNVRFDYVDPLSGGIIQSITPNGNYTGNSISDECRVTVSFNPALNNTLKGLTRQTALKAELYVVYNNNANNTGTDVRLKLNLTLQDCACCGAKTETGAWLTFMCHNLGADESLNPFTYVKGNTDGSGGTLGSLYQWGRPTDGHQKRNSPTTTTISKSSIPGNDKFILIKEDKYGTNWANIAGGDDLWGDGTQNENMPKAANDPCPAGWKVPSMGQLRSIHGTEKNRPNNVTWTGNGLQIGDALYLPAGGTRRRLTGGLSNVGTEGLYWSSTTLAGRSLYTIVLYNNGGNQITSVLSDGRASGFSVRCITE